MDLFYKKHYYKEQLANLDVISASRSRLQMFIKIYVLKNFAIFTEKHLC